MVLDPSLILLDPMMGNVCQLRCKFRCTDGGIVLTGLVATSERRNELRLMLT